jgi:hypothetical protein
MRWLPKNADFACMAPLLTRWRLAPRGRALGIGRALRAEAA